MRQARFSRWGLLALLTGWVASAGCTHNYYYGNTVPVCGSPSTAPYGSVCELPSQVVGGGTVVAQAPVGSTVVGTPKPPRVVVSEPGGSRFAWRRSDPESNLATTRVEGALDDPTISR